MPGTVLERAQVAAHALLGELALLAQVAADPKGGPILFTVGEGGPEPGGRVAQRAAPERW